MTTIATRSLRAIDPTGDAFEITVSIGSATERASGEWGCTVAITRLFEPPREICGVGSWQAVQLAFKFTVQLLAAFVSRGGKLAWFGSGDTADVEAMLPRMIVMPGCA